MEGSESEGLSAAQAIVLASVTLVLVVARVYMFIVDHIEYCKKHPIRWEGPLEEVMEHAA